MYRQMIENASARLRVMIMVTLACVLTACTTTGPAPTYPDRPVQTRPPQTKTPDVETPDPKEKQPETPDVDPDEKVSTRSGLTPPFMDAQSIKRIAIILPFSDRSETLRSEAQGLLRAAELAVFDRDDNDVLLIALDGGGTEAGTQNAVRQAKAQGADVILGPVKASSVRAAGREAAKAGIPVIGFSNDTAAAGGGVFLLSFPPEAEAKRIVDFAAGQGATKFAFLGPDSVYGRRVLSAYRQAISASGGALTANESYAGNDITVMQAPAERLAKTYINAQKSGRNEPAYHAVLMPEGGVALRSLAPLLPYFSDSLREVQFMGTGRWNDEDTAKEPALNGGVFAGPELDSKRKFESNYDATYGEEIGSLTSLGYDGVLIAAFVAAGDGREKYKRLQDPAGFYGVDGFVRFDARGAPERGLAVFQIRNGRIIEIDPAPKGPDSTT